MNRVLKPGRSGWCRRRNRRQSPATTAGRDRLRWLQAHGMEDAGVMGPFQRFAANGAGTGPRARQGQRASRGSCWLRPGCQSRQSTKGRIQAQSTRSSVGVRGGPGQRGLCSSDSMRWRGADHQRPPRGRRRTSICNFLHLKMPTPGLRGESQAWRWHMCLPVSAGISGAGSHGFQGLLQAFFRNSDLRMKGPCSVLQSTSWSPLS